MNRYTLPLTSALDGVGGQRNAPAVLPPGMTRNPLHRRQGGLQGRSGQVRKISPPTGIRTRDRSARSESLILTELSRTTDYWYFYIFKTIHSRCG